LGRSLGGLGQLEVLSRRADSWDQSIEELRDTHGLSSNAMAAGRGPPPSTDLVQSNGGIAVQHEVWEEELSGKVKTLLEELRLMVPKLLDHDRHINELQATTAELSAKATIFPPPVPTPAAAAAAAEAARLATAELPGLLQAVEAGEEHSFGPLVTQENDELHEDLACLLKHVDENEGECVRLHQQLQGSISTMDELLDKVTDQVVNHAPSDGSSVPMLALLRSRGSNTGAEVGWVSEAVRQPLRNQGGD